MTARFQFISTLTSPPATAQFQLYEAGLGIERAQVIVPLDRAAEFDALVESSVPKTMAQLRRLVSQVDGKVE